MLVRRAARMLRRLSFLSVFKPMMSFQMTPPMNSIMMYLYGYDNSNVGHIKVLGNSYDIFSLSLMLHIEHEVKCIYL